jgi:deoxyribose-phosphate aldolase
VLNYHPLLAKDYNAVHAELHALRAAASKSTLKLILETSRLTSSQIVQASVIAGRNDFDFIKTSTGFHGEGAKVKDVGVMRACAEVLAQLDAGSAKKMRVKASGGIRDLGQAEAMLEAGAVRLGCSAGVQIAQEAGGQKRDLPAELRSAGSAGQGSSGGGDY